MTRSATSFVASEAALHEEAGRRAGGADDFGDPGYLDGLRAVLQAYDAEARFSEQGRELAYGGIVDILAKRLRSEALLARMPELDRASVKRPLIVLGLVRTGSTALHHLLGRDSDRQVIEYWLGCHPQPRPPREQWEAREEYRACVAELEMMYAADPSLKAIHLMMADGPEECRHFLAQSFTDDFFEVNATVPGYIEWYEGRDLSTSYERHRRLLTLVGSTSPERQWVLKYPVHMKNLAALLATYPDACVVWTHRDPTQVLSSYISLVASFRGMFEGETDRTAIAHEQVEVWARGAERAIEVRRGCEESQFFDLHFADCVADPVGSVRRIYQHFGIEMTTAGDRALSNWVASNPKGKHGAHVHSMEEVGIARGEVLDRFAAYMNRFGIEAE